MYACPHCAAYLATPVAQCPGGRCPRCGYKPGDIDKFARAQARLAEARESAIRAGHWTRGTVVGLHFTLVDPVRIEDYFCSKAGTVSAVLGTRSEIIPPLWYWRIRDGRLQFSDGDFIKEEFTLLSMSQGVLTVRR